MMAKRYYCLLFPTKMGRTNIFTIFYYQAINAAFDKITLLCSNIFIVTGGQLLKQGHPTYKQYTARLPFSFHLTGMLSLPNCGVAIEPITQLGVLPLGTLPPAW